jgi:hypothetical protein
MVEPLRVISLGWGVQSFALAAMSALGVLPPVDAAVHADTSHERSETYAFAAKWTTWLEERGVKVVVVRAKPERLDPFYSVKKESTFLPAYTTWEDGRPSGMMRRQCTDEWKRVPLRRWFQANRAGRTVQQWIGITLDEWQRMRDSDVQYITNGYPFIDLSPAWKRTDAIRWLLDNGLEVPPKSRCVFCPFQRDADWRECKLTGNGDWTKAIEVDRQIRHKRPGYVAYLHRSCIPLENVDLRNAQDHGQLTLWDEEECTGTCFL